LTPQKTKSELPGDYNGNRTNLKPDHGRAGLERQAVHNPKSAFLRAR